MGGGGMYADRGDLMDRSVLFARWSLFCVSSSMFGFNLNCLKTITTRGPFEFMDLESVWGWTFGELLLLFECF